MKRIFILFIIMGLIGLSLSASAAIFMKGPIWYNETCNPYSYGDVKQISVSGNYVGVATECNCNVDRPEACNGVFIFDIDVSKNLSNVPDPFVHSTNGWIESVHIDVNKAAAGSSDDNIYYFEVNEYKNWQKRWEKNLEGTVLSVYVSGNYVAAASGNYVHLFDTNGNEKWKYNTNSKVNIVSIIDNKVVAGTKDSNVYIFGISGNIIKNIKTGGAIESIYVADGLIAVGSDQVYLFNSDGIEEWRSETVGTIKSVHFADGTLAAGALNNLVYIFDMDGKQKVKYLASSSIWSVHVSGNYVSAGSTEGIIYLIDTTGELKWEYKVGIPASAIRSSAVNSMYNTKDYVYAGGWGKSVYLFNSGIAIAEDEIKKADRLILTVKGEMDVTKAEAELERAKDERESGNYDHSIELSKNVEPMIIKDIEKMISETQDSLNEINNTIDTQKYTGLSTELKKEYVEIENAKEFLSEDKYIQAIRILKRPKGLIRTEIVKIIEGYEDTINKVSYWDEQKIESLLAQESEYMAMSKEETEAEIALAGHINISFSESLDKIESAKDALEVDDYETAIRLSEEAIELIELKINENIADAEKEIKEIGETPLIFKVDTSFAEKDIKVAKTRLNHSECGATYVEDCPDYSASLFWAGHSRGIANQDKTIGVVKNIVIVIIFIFAAFVAFRWYSSKKKKETAEEEEEKKEE